MCRAWKCLHCQGQRAVRRKEAKDPGAAMRNRGIEFQRVGSEIGGALDPGSLDLLPPPHKFMQCSRPWACAVLLWA